ncbi:hypothetical protein [Mesorhizobium hawassense]|nr:hypothetical protein [Mesorhizobium hawassense]
MTRAVEGMMETLEGAEAMSARWKRSSLPNAPGMALPRKWLTLAPILISQMPSAVKLLRPPSPHGGPLSMAM